MPTPELSLVAQGHAPSGKNALKISFAESTQAPFAGRAVRANDAWDRAAGLSFALKGSGGFVCVTLIDESFARRYSALVSLAEKEWREVRLRWADFVPESAGAEWSGKDGAAFKPSGIRALWIGRPFFLKPWDAVSFQVARLRLEEKIEARDEAPPSGAGLAHTLARLRAKEPVTLVCIGDSITVGEGLPDREHQAFPARLEALLKERFGYAQISVRNRGVNGLETRQGLILLPREFSGSAPDLVIAHFGYNDFTAMTERKVAPEAARAAAAGNFRQLIQRVRNLSLGKTEVLLVATAPGALQSRHTAMAFFGEEAQKAAQELRAGFADGPRQAFAAALAAGKLDGYFARQNGGLDFAHPNEAGHEAFARALLDSFPKE
jgi:sialate O-acetylesterase